MRLTQIKLVGFKSFVDSTTINVPGQLVGVVGPNGCGKSNIIDAVRWVLGESRASALRGDSMQDVIFNGSAQRSPVARSSVELHFDNALGKASGAWSQYAEIAVKRVLQRDGESSYFINNTHVRRRDIQDIFMGTGLGPRAYAIIEQGMISRIIEAKPEELRIFLEEAAGISKYKERRKETEHRLTDTRENLARVTDILQELGTQIEKLEQQAEVAKRHQELSGERDLKQNLLILLKRNEAQVEAEKHLQEVECLGLEIEAETAGLRSSEKSIEQVRVELHLAADSLAEVQANLYKSNAAVSSLESEIRFLTDTRQRVRAQLEQSRMVLGNGDRRNSELLEALCMWRERIEVAGDRLVAAIEGREIEASKLPRMEEAHKGALSQLSAVLSKVAECEGSLDLEQTHVGHAAKTLQGLENRKQRLVAERLSLSVPEQSALLELEQELSISETEINEQEAVLYQLESDQSGLEQQKTQAQADLQMHERELSGIDAKLTTLQRIQVQSDENKAVDQWLDRHGLLGRPRLWQKLSVSEGWETAIESVLREKLHSLEIEDLEFLGEVIGDLPPSRVLLHCPADWEAEQSVVNGKPLVDLVQCIDPRFSTMLRRWLSGFVAVDSLPSLGERLSIDEKTVLVTREGHQFSRYGFVFHAADSLDSGILVRQKEIEGLIEAVAEKDALIESGKEILAELTSKLEEHLLALSTSRITLQSLKQRHYEKQLQQVKKLQENERYRQRYAQISEELDDIAIHEETERAACLQAEDNAARMRVELEAIRNDVINASTLCDEIGDQLKAQRDTLNLALREEQDAGFAERECKTKIAEIEVSIKVAEQQIEAAAQQVGQFEDELSKLDDRPLQIQLDESVKLRAGHEKALSDARAVQDTLSDSLRIAESARVTHEAKLDPLRERIAELRLKHQAASLLSSQHTAQLIANGADEEVLAGLLKQGQKAVSLQGEINRLANAIAELGAINMAALDELVMNRERKQYLDSQYADLAEALDILDGAIRKIDRETREMLQTTFNLVNEHFGSLFPALFGGGEARLEMTGEEILDSGVQVIARPPGKKNSSIHLLSGGEKALTAIALVFAMFQLNPAPFCLLDEVDAPLDDANTVRFCELVSKMSQQTQFLFISHNKITMEMSTQLVGVTMQEQGVSRVVAVDIEEALKMREPIAA